MDQQRLDKATFTINDLHDKNSDLEYWQNQTPQDRIAAIELMRRINYGTDISTARLARFFEVVEFPPS